MLSHVLANNPRVNYAHQTNLIGPATAPGGADYGYTILGLIGNMQDQYDSYYNAANSPLVHINDAIEAQTLADQAAWADSTTPPSRKARPHHRACGDHRKWGSVRHAVRRAAVGLGRTRHRCH